MRKKFKYEAKYTESKKNVRLAKFWRYGYWICALAIATILHCFEIGEFLLWQGLFFICYGIYSIIIMKKPERYFLLGMLDVEHKEMKLHGSGYDMVKLEDWRREERFMSIFFILFGIVCVVINLVYK